MKKAWFLLAVLALVAVLGMYQVNETAAVGFCGAEEDCGALCYCSDPHNAIVPAWCCPASVCYENAP